MAITLGCQSSDTGSIPVTRSAKIIPSTRDYFLYQQRWVGLNMLKYIYESKEEKKSHRIDNGDTK